MWDRLALWLWRDRNDYDPATGRIGPKNNVSLWTRWRPGRQRLTRTLFNGPLWLTILAGIFALVAALLPAYRDASKADEQVNPLPGKLLLQCVDKGQGLFECHPATGGDDHISAPGDRKSGKPGLAVTSKP